MEQIGIVGKLYFLAACVVDLFYQISWVVGELGYVSVGVCLLYEISVAVPKRIAAISNTTP
jgi:hypothetical protein